MTLRVAFDMTPTLGTRTGIGNVVSHMHSAISDMSDVELQSYTLSLKARSYKSELPSDNTFVVYPARLLLFAWKYTTKFTLDSAVKDVDVWHATNYLAPPTSKPLLVTIHDVTMKKFPELVSSQVKALAPMIQKRIDSGTHIHVPAQAIKEDVIMHFDNVDESRIHIIPFALPDILDSNPSEPIKLLCEGDPYILSIGALEPRKNHARMIAAFEEVHRVHPHVRLVIVGPDGPARPAIDEALSNLSLSARSHVVITGAVSDADRSYLLRNAYALSYISIYEGFGLPLLEAMATQTPIVTARSGSLEEVAGSAAVFVDNGDVDDIARGLNEILADHEMRDKLIASGNERISDFSWEKTATMLHNVYENMAENKGPST